MSYCNHGGGISRLLLWRCVADKAFYIVLRQLGRVLCGGNTKETKMTKQMNIDFKNKKNSLKSILFSGLLTLGFLGTGFVGEVYGANRENLTTVVENIEEKEQEAKIYTEQYFPKTYEFLKKCPTPLLTKSVLESLNEKIPDTKSIDTTISECFESLYKQKSREDWNNIDLYIRLSHYLRELSKIDQTNNVNDIRNALEFVDKIFSLSNIKNSNTLFKNCNSYSFLYVQLQYLYAIVNATSIELNEIKEIENTAWAYVYDHIKEKKISIKTIEDLNKVVETVKKIPSYWPHCNNEQEFINHFIEKQGLQGLPGIFSIIKEKIRMRFFPKNRGLRRSGRFPG